MKEYKFALKTIEISDIKPNPNNPRGLRVRYNDDQFSYLKRSIKQFGLLVPFVVQELEGEKKKYRLVDGERRYWALKELGSKTVSANVIIEKVDEDEVKNIMFHIHTNRVQWNPCQQCKALESLYEQLKIKFDKNEKKMEIELVKLTGTNKRTAKDRLNFLRWPMSIKQKAYDGDLDLFRAIVEIEEGIIKPAEKNFPEYFNIVNKNDVRELLLKKYINGVVCAGIEVRKVNNILRTSKEDKVQYKYALKLFNKLVTKIDYTYEEAQEEFFEKFPESEQKIKDTYKGLQKHLHKTTTILKNYNITLLSQMLTEVQIKELIKIFQKLEKAIVDFKKYFSK
jgi:ParB/RepB/Spo0J family partition protein